MNKFLYALPALLLLAVPSVFAASVSLTIATDRTSYSPGQTVAISGTTTGLPAGTRLNVPIEYFTRVCGMFFCLNQPTIVTVLYPATDSTGHYSATYTLPSSVTQHNWNAYAWVYAGGKYYYSNGAPFTVA